MPEMFGPTVEMEGPPFPGQRKPVPENIGRGFWIAEDVAYLSTDDTHDGREETIHLMPPLPDGTSPYVFSASMVASAFRIPVDFLLAANGAGKLGLVPVDHEFAPRQDGSFILKFRFLLGHDTADFDVVTSEAGGNA